MAIPYSLTSLMSFEAALMWETRWQKWPAGDLKRLDQYMVAKYTPADWDDQKISAISALCDPCYMDSALVALISRSTAFNSDGALRQALAETLPIFPRSKDAGDPRSRSNLSDRLYNTFSPTRPVSGSGTEFESAVVGLFCAHWTDPRSFPVTGRIRTALETPDVRSILVDFMLTHDWNSFHPQTDSLLALFAEKGAFTVTPTPEHRKSAIHVLKAVFRLVNLAASASHIVPLLQAGIESAVDLATAKPEVIAAIHVDGLDKSTQNAVNIATRNHIESRSTMVALADFLRGTGIASVDQGSAGDRTTAVDNLMDSYGFDGKVENLVGEIDNFQCDHCRSFASPAAYFVELLRFLPDEAREQLRKRRPDIFDLQLTCENTDVALPYMDLAIEVMELYIWHLVKNRSVNTVIPEKFNNLSDDESADLIADPRINSDMVTAVYSGTLPNAFFPFSTLPYVFAMDKVRMILKSLTTSRYELMTLFQCGKLDTEVSRPGEASRGTEDAALAERRAATAEYLNLCQQDFIAITKEAFWNGESLAKALNIAELTDVGQYHSKIGLPTLYQLWGYASMDDMKSSDVSRAANNRGLYFLKEGFLPRSALSYPEYVQLTSTFQIGSLLPVFDDKASSDIQYNLNLPDYMWDKIQSFLRLRLRSGLSMDELDNAISSFNGFDTALGRIDPNFLDTLVDIKKLSSLTDIDILSLLTLWDTMSLRGPRTLFNSIYQKRNIQRLDPDFAKALPPISKDGVPTWEVDGWQKYLKTVLAAVGCTQAAYNSIMECTHPKMSSPSQWKQLNLENVTILYRCVIHTKCMKIPQYSIGLALQMFPSILDNPQSTLNALTIWSQFTKHGYSLEQVSYITASERDPTSTLDISDKIILEAARSINTGLTDLHNQSKHSIVVTVEHVKDLVSKAFNADEASEVMDSILGNDIHIVHSIPRGYEKDLNHFLPSRLRYVDDANADDSRFELRGLLSEAQLTAIHQDLRKLNLSDEKIGKVISGVEGVQRLATANAQKIVALFRELLGPSKSPALEDKSPLLQSNDQTDDKGKPSGLSAKLDHVDQLLTPYVKRSAQEQVIASALCSALGIADQHMLLFILKNFATTEADRERNKKQRSGSEFLDHYISVCRKARPRDRSWSAFLVPPTSEAYSFIADEVPSPIELNGSELSWSQSSCTTTWTTNPIPLIAGKVYPIVFPATAGQVGPLQWKHTTMPARDIDTDAVILKEIFEETQQLLWKLNRVMLTLASVD